MDTWSNNLTISDTPLDSHISSEIVELINLVNNAIFLLAVSFVGILFNLTNIVTFAKMGLHDPVNITLLGLSASDLGASCMLLTISVFRNPALVSHLGILGYPISWPHLAFIRTSSWLTMHTTVERYLCIAFPLKVKRMVTSQRSLTIVCLIFFIFIASVVPPFFAFTISQIFLDQENESVYHLEYVESKRYLEDASVTFNSYALLACFPTVVVLTSFLVGKLVSKAKWRNVTISAANNEKTNTRDKKVVKMIIFIACTFLICFLPEVLITILMQFTPEFNPLGQFAELYYITWSFIFCFESTNSTVPIFIYLKMSSKYRRVFFAIFGRNKTTETKVGRLKKA